MSTSPDDERQENSVCENVCETLKTTNSVIDCKSACLSASLDEQCGKLINSVSKENTVGNLTTHNDSQDKTVSNDNKVNGSEEKLNNDVLLDYAKDEYSADVVSVNKEDIPTRINLTCEEICFLSKDDLADCWLRQNKYISFILSKLETNINDETKVLQENEEKLKIQLTETQKKEQYHGMRLTAKEHELQELGIQTDELKGCMGGASIKYCALDPTSNLMFEKMKRDLDLTKSKMEETQNELAAWKFTPDSNTGKQLMAKCRLLIKENEELGKMISSGRLSKLEGDLSLQKNFSDEFKKSQSEVDEFLQEMDEDTEGMQGTILYLQSQLRRAKENISQLNGQIAAGNSYPINGGSTSTRTIDDVSALEVAFPNGGNCSNIDSEGEHISEKELVSIETENDGIEVGCKRTRSVLDDDLDSTDLCVSYKRERTKSPQLLENGL